MLIITSQPRPDRLRRPIKFCDMRLSADLVPAVVGKEVGAKASRLNAGGLDTEPGHLLEQRFSVDGYSGFGGAVQTGCWCA